MQGEMHLHVLAELYTYHKSHAQRIQFIESPVERTVQSKLYLDWFWRERINAHIVLASQLQQMNIWWRYQA